MNGTANQPLLEVKGLCKSFGKLEVLKSIDQNIYKGEKVAVIGPSGSGKSTFLRCFSVLLRLLPLTIFSSKYPSFTITL